VPDIFLSYNREDTALAQAYRDALLHEGFDVWWDATLRSGETYDEVTEKALRGAKAVVVLWSPRSVASHWVRAEATIAFRNKTLVPATIEPCDKPVMFELTQTAELSHWRGEADDKAWQSFLGDVRRMVGRDQSATAEVVARPPATPGTGIPSVGVLPFTHRGGEDLEVLAEDLTEEITRELAQGWWCCQVIAAGTMAAGRGKTIEHKTLGGQLGARYLVEGKLQRSGEDARMTVQLIEVATTSMVWSQRFVRNLAELAAAPEETTASIASEIGEQIMLVERSRAMTKPGPFSGWEYALRAMAYTARLGPDSMRNAIDEARRAVEAAPDFGLAHAMLAGTLAVLVTLTDEHLEDTVNVEIHAHVKRALQLDGDNCMVLAWLVAVYRAIGDRDACLRLAERAVELYPNASGSLQMLGAAYLHLGRSTDAIATFTQLERHLSRGHLYYVALSNLGLCYLLEGQMDNAEAAFDRSLALHPDFHAALTWKAILSARRGEEQAAVATIRQLKEVEPSMSIDQHVRQIVQYPFDAERSSEHIAVLRRLWEEIGH
jgi:TolB-like protein